MLNNQFEYLPVNWVDGMKINKSHFIAQNNAHTHHMALGLSTTLNEFNYGLLPVSGNVPKISVSIDNQQQVQVRLLQCQAVTRGGHLIQLTEGEGANAQANGLTQTELNLSFQRLKGKSSDFYIVLVINPFERNPFGQADLTELSPRLPFTRPAYTLHLIPADELSSHSIGEYQLPIGKISLLENNVSLDDAYIPPCARISSHYELINVHAGMEQFFSKLELNSLQIIQKIFQKKQQNDMAQIVQKLGEQVIQFTSAHLGSFKLEGMDQAPLHLVNRAVAFARLLKNSLDFYIGSGKEELINYFVDWCGVGKGELESCLTDLAHHPYDHLNIQSSIDKMEAMARCVGDLWMNLAKLDYIGKRKDTGIFVKEQVSEKEQGSSSKSHVNPPTSDERQGKRNSFFLE
ncbi:type VI secretion system baseplate subunit TssK [Cyclobacterium plantarum]|uniref:Type VI secretion system baseplate subunit TssK n=1 Tax=Cyclobacterium plantarum TaxID=2716263 RepID=A0ABX0HE66_9BACT|nr:type VI secretion system baseplate subunit TssK [Cyclobacterium plantarum]NHE58471.1 type VI secretion system baseplate subunit TssK [Cyclobacterium plantarum]